MGAKRIYFTVDDKCPHCRGTGLVEEHVERGGDVVEALCDCAQKRVSTRFKNSKEEVAE